MLVEQYIIIMRVVLYTREKTIYFQNIGFFKFESFICNVMKIIENRLFNNNAMKLTRFLIRKKINRPVSFLHLTQSKYVC